MSVRDDFDAELRTLITRAVRDATGLHKPLSASIASVVMGKIWRELSGTRPYFPKRGEKLADRIRAAYDGNNVRQLMRRHRVSRATVCRAIAEIETVSRRREEQRQP